MSSSAMSLQISITANGQSFTLPAGQSIGDFLRSRGFRPGLAVVEYNGRALTPAVAGGLQLHNGDRLEIVRIVAVG